MKGTYGGFMFVMLLKWPSSPKISKSCPYFHHKNKSVFRFLTQIFIWIFFNQAQINTKSNKTDVTLTDSWKPYSIRLLNFLTSSNLIPEENEREMYIEKLYIWRPRESSTTFACSFYVRYLRACWPNYILLRKVTFRYDGFL